MSCWNRRNKYGDRNYILEYKLSNSQHNKELLVSLTFHGNYKIKTNQWLNKGK